VTYLDDRERGLLAALDDVEATCRAKIGGSMTFTKTLGHVEIKNADRGEVSAVIATFGSVDSDGDVTLPGAFMNNGEFPISAYNHTSWGGQLPVGVASIRETATEAIIDGQFFLDTAAGRDTFTTVKRLHERGLGEWSYGYDPVDAYHGEYQGQKVRFLPKQLVHEASPVLKGAGVGTRTLGVKSGFSTNTGVQPVTTFKAAMRPHETDTTTAAWDAAAVMSAMDDPSIADLRAVHAWMDGSMDPETKGAYKFPHHVSPGGPANVRRCVAGIAELNGARGGTSIPEGDRKGVYEHLAAHLRDADREVPELRSLTSGELKFHDECAVALVSLGALIDRAGEVMQIRGAKGKKLAASSMDLLEWVFEEMRRLKSIIDTPQEEMAREYVRFIKSLHK
jgi:hypothetical protein